MRDLGGDARQHQHYTQVSPLDAGERGRQRRQEDADGGGGRTHCGDGDVDDAAFGQEEQGRVRRQSGEAAQGADVGGSGGAQAAECRSADVEQPLEGDSASARRGGGGADLY